MPLLSKAKQRLEAEMEPSQTSAHVLHMQMGPQGRAMLFGLPSVAGLPSKGTHEVAEGSEEDVWAAKMQLALSYHHPHCSRFKSCARCQFPQQPGTTHCALASTGSNRDIVSPLCPAQICRDSSHTGLSHPMHSEANLGPCVGVSELEG